MADLRRVGHYALPRSADGESAERRLTNSDLDWMTGAELRGELARIQLALGLARPEQLDRVYVDLPRVWTPRDYLTGRERAIATLVRDRRSR